MNSKRLFISLLLAALFGVFCAYGTSTVEIKDFEITIEYLLTIFYARVLIGLVIGIGDHVMLTKNTYTNAAVRGGLFGFLVSIVISFYGGGVIFIGAGVFYGMVIDVVATRFS